MFQDEHKNKISGMLLITGIVFACIVAGYIHNQSTNNLPQKKSHTEPTPVHNKPQSGQTHPSSSVDEQGSTSAPSPTHNHKPVVEVRQLPSDGATENVSADVLLKEGKELLANGKHDEALTKLKNAAAEGSGEARYILGEIYLNGKFVEKDLKKSIQYFTTAADLGYPQAQFLLGSFYFQGKYVEKDLEKSKHYYHLAAKTHYVIAQYVYGTCLIYGALGEANYEEGLRYLEAAAKAGNADAQFSLGIVLLSTADFLPHTLSGLKYHK